MNTIRTNELKEILDTGPVALFDVRGDIAYEQGHIPGAKTAPLGSLVFRVASVMNNDSFIVVYSDDNDNLAKEAVERLNGLRHNNVYYLKDGIGGWKAAGLDVIESPKPKLIAQGPVTECRPVVVDTERAYGGAFKTTITDDIGGAGG